MYGAAIVLGGTLLIAAFRVFRKYNTPQNKRKRNVSKNKVWCSLTYSPHMLLMRGMLIGLLLYDPPRHILHLVPCC